MPMNKLILEFEKNRKVVREPESRFCFIFKNLEKYECVKHPNSLLYRNEKGDILAKQDLKNGNIWLDYKYLWSIFNDKYGRNYNKTQLVIKSLLETYFKPNGLTPFSHRLSTVCRLETYFKPNGLTPMSINYNLK